MRSRILVACLGVLLAVSTTYGEIYKWVDQHGKAHFTDILANVPPAYRSQAEQKAPSSSTSSQTRPRPQRAIPATASVALTPASYRVPLQRRGNAMVVQVVLNGAVASPLIVDTGAEFTVISHAVARQLGLNVDRAAVIPLRSASGLFLAPIMKVGSLAVGDATVEDVEVIVHDATPGLGGLLGMSFLDHFAVTISPTDRALTLTAADRAPGTELYGGHPQVWWRRKFRFYRRQIEEAKSYLALQSSLDFRRTLRYFQRELAVLERQATLAAVPRHWRQKK